MAVQTYSMRTDANTNVSEHFKVREFACNDGSDTVLIDDDLVTRLERIRGVFGSGITITSGYRTPSYNASVGGATSSQHVKGTAADIQLRGVPPLAVANYVEETFSTGGIGVYRTFTHVDVRSSRVIWKNNGSNTSSTTGASEGYWKDFQNGADPGGGGEGGGGESGAIDVTVRRFTVVFKRPNGKPTRQLIFRVTVTVGGTLMIPNFIAVMIFWETINSILKLATGRILLTFKISQLQIFT